MLVYQRVPFLVGFLLPLLGFSRICQVAQNGSGMGKGRNGMVQKTCRISSFYWWDTTGYHKVDMGIQWDMIEWENNQVAWNS